MRIFVGQLARFFSLMRFEKYKGATVSYSVPRILFELSKLRRIHYKKKKIDNFFVD